MIVFLFWMFIYLVIGACISGFVAAVERFWDDGFLRVICTLFWPLALIVILSIVVSKFVENKIDDWRS